MLNIDMNDLYSITIEVIDQITQDSRKGSVLRTNTYVFPDVIGMEVIATIADDLKHNRDEVTQKTIVIEDNTITINDANLHQVKYSIIKQKHLPF